jgi:hypothetical protein
LPKPPRRTSLFKVDVVPEAAVVADDVEPLFAIEPDLRAGTNAPHARLCFPYPTSANPMPPGRLLD